MSCATAAGLSDVTLGNERIRIDQGHATFEHVFTRAEMARLLEALSTASLDRTKAGARHILSVPAVRDLCADPRMLDIASQFVGATAVPFRATLFDKSPGANWLVVWHQDTALPLRARIEDAEWGPWSTKAGVIYAHAPAWALEQVVALRVSLDDSTETNGPLRVLPDTHRGGVLSAADIESLARETIPVNCLAASGGVVAMCPLTIHASSKSTDAQPRRVLHIEYAAAVRLSRGIELALG
jgi:ectoine hydroxylase-related dioxygenase (phytanoyl-CoA dioxygenase family)